MSQASDVKDTATRLLSGILSNPNYNFDNIKKVVDVAVDHARALVLKLDQAAEAGAQKAVDTTKAIETKLTPKPSNTTPDPLKTV